MNPGTVREGTTQTTLLAGALLGAVSGSIFAYVGWRLSRREVPLPSRLPMMMFAAWWQLLAATTLIGAAATCLAALQRLDTDIYVALTYFTLMLIAMALGALLYYLLYLFTGRLTLWKPLLFVVSGTLVYLIYFIRRHDPMGIQVRRWDIAIHYAQPLETDPQLLAVFLLLVGPQIIAALAYLSLAFKARDATQRYRIIVVSVAILVWFGSALAASARGLSGSDAWQLVSRFIGVAAALAILGAYYPPKALRKRWGVATVETKPPPPP